MSARGGAGLTPAHNSNFGSPTAIATTHWHTGLIGRHRIDVRHRGGAAPTVTGRRLLECARAAESHGRRDRLPARAKLGQAGKWDDALAPLLRLRESNPENANIANLLGAAYYQTFDYEKAISAFTAAATLAPKNEDFAANLKKPPRRSLRGKRPTTRP